MARVAVIGERTRVTGYALGGAVVMALGQRDGLSMDKLLIAAVRHRLTPRARPPDLADPSASAGAGSIGGQPPISRLAAEHRY